MSLSLLLYFFTYTPNLHWPNPYNTHAFLASLKHNSFTSCSKYTHTHTHTHIYIYIYIYIHTHVCTHTHTHTHIYIYIYIYINQQHLTPTHTLSLSFILTELLLRIGQKLLDAALK